MTDNIVTISGEVLARFASQCPEGVELQAFIRQELERRFGLTERSGRKLCTRQDPCGVCRALDGKQAGAGALGEACPVQGCAVVLTSGEVVEYSPAFALWAGWGGSTGESILSLFPMVTSDTVTGLFSQSALSGEPIFIPAEKMQDPEDERVLHVEPILHGDNCNMAYRVTAAPANEIL